MAQEFYNFFHQWTNLKDQHLVYTIYSRRFSSCIKEAQVIAQLLYKDLPLEKSIKIEP